jgi:hypothetical protein
MCCWKMKLVTDSSYTGPEIVYTSVIAVLNWKLVVKNICVCMILGKCLEREFFVLRRYILHVV